MSELISQSRQINHVTLGTVLLCVNIIWSKFICIQLFFLQYILVSGNHRKMDSLEDITLNLNCSTKTVKFATVFSLNYGNFYQICAFCGNFGAYF